MAGHTGSGKSTLVQHLNGLIRPQEGSVCALGLDLSNKKDAAAVKAKVGVVFQYPERQLFAETVAQDVAFGPHNLGLPQAEVDRRVESSLSRVGLDLSTVGDKSPFELSGGQQRRVAFAGVLAMEPEVLVLDEPMAGLDPAARSDFLELIDRLHREGLTVVMVSHSMDDLANCCDRIVVMNEGAVFAEGTPAQVFAHADELKSIGLGVPAAQRMALALAEAGVPLRRGGLYTVESLADELADLLIGRSDGSSDVSDIAKSEDGRARGGLLMEAFSFGSYYPGDSAIHRLDPRTKLLLGFVFLITTLTVSGFRGLAPVAIFVVLTYAVSRVPVRRVLSSMAPLLAIVVGGRGAQLVYRSERAHSVAARLSADKRGLAAFCRLYGVPPDL